ncbi:MAG: hypothetical protein AAF706_00830 [Bacteroidota bacterium]
MKQGIEEYLQSKHVDTRPIEGFRVMEWLRGVRDANYALSINDPTAYKRKREGLVLAH